MTPIFDAQADRMARLQESQKHFSMGMPPYISCKESLPTFAFFEYQYFLVNKTQPIENPTLTPDLNKYSSQNNTDP